MNTKLIMTASAIILGAMGIVLTFIPDIILRNLRLETDTAGISLILVQILGALYFAFGMLNWTARRNVIGGIYNKPIAVANFSHFFIAGMALLKALLARPELPYFLWGAGLLYLLFALCFGLITFRHPIAAEKARKN